MCVCVCIHERFPWWLSSKESALSAGEKRSFTGSKRSLREGNATHSSILAWEISWTEELCLLQTMWLQRVGHNLETKQQQHLYIPHLLYPFIC